MKSKFIKLSVLLTLMSAGATSQSIYPSGVVQFNQGLQLNNSSVQLARSNPQNSLGEPQDNDIETGILNFVSLGFGGTIVLSMPSIITVTEETAVCIFETTYGMMQCSTYPERANIYLSEDGIDYVLLGTSCVNDNMVMYPSGKIAKFQYIKIVDVSKREDFNTANADAYDLDGIAITKFGTLPVEMRDISLSYYQGALNLSFVTLSERNTKSFVLENISSDRSSWMDVIEFKAAGESSNTRKYSQTVSFQPVSNVSYFRIKETELDGKITYHRMMAVQTLESGGSLKVLHDALGREVGGARPFAIYIK